MAVLLNALRSISLLSLAAGELRVRLVGGLSAATTATADAVVCSLALRGVPCG